MLPAQSLKLPVLPGQFCPKSPILVSNITKFPTVLAQNHRKITRFLTKTTYVHRPLFLHFYVTIFSENQNFEKFQNVLVNIFLENFVNGLQKISIKVC